MTVCSELKDASLLRWRLGALSRLLGGALVLSALTVPSEAEAQSAADKATARELAVEGIKKFGAGDAEGALKSLEKAQALYDAPIHLIYLARAHAKLGHLVEAAEAYRSLARATIGADAPEAFRKAQEEGQVELEALEPRLSKLTIEVQPEVEGMEVTVDDKTINTAALSVPRATNPGHRVVRVTAPGYLPVESEITLVEGGSEVLRLALEVDPEAPVNEDGVLTGSSASGGTGAAEHTNSDKISGPMGFIIGLRAGAVLPVGALYTDVASTDYFQPGAGGRGELGFRFLRYLGIKGYFSMGALSPGGEVNNFAEEQGSGIVAKNSGSFQDAGVAVMGTTDPRTLGGFGEVGFSFLHKYKWQQEFTGEGVDCAMSADYSGWAVRAGGGMNIPANRLLNFVPAVDVSVGQFGNPTLVENCSANSGTEGVVGADTRFDGGLEPAFHYQIFLGFGVDLHFGDNLFQ